MALGRIFKAYGSADAIKKVDFGSYMAEQAQQMMEKAQQAAHDD